MKKLLLALKYWRPRLPGDDKCEVIVTWAMAWELAGIIMAG